MCNVYFWPQSSERFADRQQRGIGVSANRTLRLPSRVNGLTKGTALMRRAQTSQPKSLPFSPVCKVTSRQLQGMDVLSGFLRVGCGLDNETFVVLENFQP